MLSFGMARAIRIAGAHLPGGGVGVGKKGGFGYELPVVPITRFSQFRAGVRESRPRAGAPRGWRESRRSPSNKRVGTRCRARRCRCGDGAARRRSDDDVTPVSPAFLPRPRAGGLRWDLVAEPLNVNVGAENWAGSMSSRAQRPPPDNPQKANGGPGQASEDPQVPGRRRSRDCVTLTTASCADLRGRKPPKLVF